MALDGSKLAKALRVKPGTRVKLAGIDPRDASHLGKEEDARAGLAEDAAEIDKLQDRLYAEGRRAVLVILQGTDTSGKDGTIRHVFNTTGPLGVSVTAFRRPSEEELAHDFLWRAHLAAPRRGTIGIFNRSHYEDVLVGKVRKLAPGKEIERRYDQINDFERILVENGTTILKFMLLISREEQAERLRERLDDPRKRWKFNPADIEDRALWDEYVAAYETMLERCSTEHAPWHVVPADRKWARNAAVARIVRATLEAMDPQYPRPDWDPKDFEIV
ncbi:MAG TPA: polyphosphate kinase 2 family protein [Beijerinckiaceae bacterium]|jgi:PPK2 family polyphosphate:nucleotide phosphotransferase